MTRPVAPAFQQYQLFLASPGDVHKERRYVEEVIGELNRTIARSKRVFLQTRRWELDTFPQMGKDAQAIINEQIADMAKCKLFVGIMWNRIGTKTRRSPSGTTEEYDRAIKSMRKHRQPEVWFYFRKPKLESPTNDQLHQLEQVNTFRARVESEGLSFSFKTPYEFRELFRKHVTLWLENASIGPSSEQERKFRLNSFKLYYFRRTRRLSYTDVARDSGIDRTVLRRLENVNPARAPLSIDSFPEIDPSTLTSLERTLNCQGKLAAGQVDDFLSQYLLFYDTYKRLGHAVSGVVRDSRQEDLRFKTQAVVFDFGGTLTQPRGRYTTWETLWRKLGYSVNECSELHRRYQSGELSHQQWCDKTCAAFRARKLTDRHIREMAQRVRLVPGVAGTVHELRKRGIRLYIASGSLKPIIMGALGTLYAEFEEIRANDVSFDPRGIISKIRSTPYDFKGKADFLRRIARELGVSPLDILFVGNSCNDVFASESGVRTLCVNPRFTDPDKQEHWTYSIREMTDLKEILKYVYL